MFIKLIPKLNTKELTMGLFTSHFFFQFIHFKAFKFNAFLVFSNHLPTEHIYSLLWAAVTGSQTPPLYYKLFQWFSKFFGYFFFGSQIFGVRTFLYS